MAHVCIQDTRRGTSTSIDAAVSQGLGAVVDALLIHGAAVNAKSTGERSAVIYTVV